MLQDVVSICQRTKITVFYDVLCFPNAAKNRQTFAKNGPKSTSETHLGFWASLYPARGPQKRLNPSSLKDFFLGGSAAGAWLRVARASCMLQHTRRGADAHRRLRRIILDLRFLRRVGLKAIEYIE